jgi:hypothetical protein
MLQALGEVVEQPTGFCFSEKMTPLEFWEMYVVVSNVVGQYLTIQLRTAAIKMNSGQRGCGLRTCGLFHCLPEYALAKCCDPDLALSDSRSHSGSSGPSPAIPLGILDPGFCQSQLVIFPRKQKVFCLFKK